MRWITPIILFWILWAAPGYAWDCETKKDNYPRWSVLEEGKDWLLVTRRNPKKRVELRIEPGSAKKIRGGDEPVFQVMFDGKIEVLYCEAHRSLSNT